MTPADEKTLSLARGVHQRSGVTRVPDGFARRAINVISSGSGLRRRPGYEQLVAGTEVTSLWSDGRRALFTDAGVLKSVESTGEVTTLASGLVGNVCYAEVAEEVYVSSAQRNLVVSGSSVRPWAPDAPAGFASVTFSAAGTLPQANYTMALALRDADGRQGPALLVPVTGSGAIAITLPVIPAGHSLAVYLTQPDGDVPYLVGTFDFGTTSIEIAGLPPGPPLDQRFLESMPVGADSLFAYNGRLYGVYGGVIVYSEALRYGLTNLDANFLQFESPVDFAAPVLDGIFVGRGGKTVFLAGADPAAFAPRPLSVPDYIPGAPSPVRPSWFGLQAQDDEGYCWLTTGGPVIGVAGGQVFALADDRLRLPGAERATTAVLEHEGERHIVSATRNPKADALVASDLVETQIIRNGRLVI